MRIVLILIGAAVVAYLLALGLRTFIRSRSSQTQLPKRKP